MGGKGENGDKPLLGVARVTTHLSIYRMMSKVMQVPSLKILTVWAYLGLYSLEKHPIPWWPAFDCSGKRHLCPGGWAPQRNCGVSCLSWRQEAVVNRTWLLREVLVLSGLVTIPSGHRWRAFLEVRATAP